MSAAQMPRAASVRVWDPLVRVAHGSLAVAVAMLTGRKRPPQPGDR